MSPFPPPLFLLLFLLLMSPFPPLDPKELRALIEKTGGSEELWELVGQLSGVLGKYGASGLGELIDAIG
jgi:hypothetical protein